MLWSELGSSACGAKRRLFLSENVLQTGAKHPAAAQRPQARTRAVGTGARTYRTGDPQALEQQLDAETRSIAGENKAAPNSDPRYAAVLLSVNACKLSNIEIRESV